MDCLGKYPDDPQQTFLGENNTVSVLGQEAAIAGSRSSGSATTRAASPNALLGRDVAHWSFFFDSDASVMEGNDIEDLGGGSFRTTAAVQRYSQLDQYAMGLLPPRGAAVLLRGESGEHVAAEDRIAAPRTASRSTARGATC